MRCFVFRPFEQTSIRARCPPSNSDGRNIGQYLVDALIENVEIALGRRPVPIGADAVPTYVYSGEIVHNGIRMAGSEVGLFHDKSEITHKMDFSDLSDEELIMRLRDETEALLLEKRAAGLKQASGRRAVST
jgi:hypothetical protein